MNIIDYINVIEDICIGVFNNNQIELIKKKRKIEDYGLRVQKVHEK